MIELNPANPLGAQTTAESVRIKIVGLGGAGSNALDRLVLDGVPNADLIAINTDVQSLTSSVATEKVQLGRMVTRGLGAGGDPEVGAAAAEEGVEEIRAALSGAGMVFICVGLGGGTGSGAGPMVAHLAREQNALVVVFATMPFSFEGKRRAAQAAEALASIQQQADAVICFENDKLGDAVSPKAGIHQAFASCDQTISQSVRSICELFQRPGLIHIGFDDLVSALRNNDPRCLFAYGESEGDNRAHEALARALKSPLMDRGRLLSDARNVLVNISGGSDLTLHEVQTLMEELARHISDDTRICFGASVDPQLGKRMTVTLISSIGVDGAEIPIRSEPARALRPAQTASPAHAAPAITHATSDNFGSQDSLLDVDPTPAAAQATDAVSGEGGSGEKSPQAKLARASSKPKSREETQETLQFEAVTRGRFEKSEPTIVDGQDLDVPTFLRRNIRVK